MENTTYIGLSRQSGLRQALDVVANNIANVNTPGYQAERIVFREFLVKPRNESQISFVQDVGTARDLSDGPLQRTGNPLDVALNGEGYFVLDTPLGERYTRHGRFQLNADGQIVTNAGYSVAGNGGPIQVNPNGGQITITKDGTVSDETGVLGQLRVVRFDDPQQLRKAAGSSFIAPDGVNPQNVNTPTIVQGMVEGSNVNAIGEMTRMITLHRTHDSVAKFIQQEDKRQKDMIQTLGGTPGG